MNLNDSQKDFAKAEVESSIPAQFEKMVAQYPKHVAIDLGDSRLTYEELNIAANRRANGLIAHGAPADRVTILMQPDAPQLAAILAVLKAGRIVVVLNPSEPPTRLAQIFTEADSQTILTDFANRELAEQIAGNDKKIFYFEDHNGGAAHNPEIEITPDAPGLILFTSGSTGRPKGVLQTHRNILHNILRLSRGMRLRAEDRITLLASPSGGQGVSTMWCAWLNGATLCPFPLMEHGLGHLAEWVIARQITIFIATASVFRSFMRTLNATQFFPSVRVIRLASEPVISTDFDSFQRHFSDDCIVFNSLSSSETGNITQHPFRKNARVAAGRLPAGWPAAGVEILLLDEQDREVGANETGEIVVRSHYLSPGYWRNEKLTAERFSERDGVRIFRSGDLGKWLSDGSLMFMDRKDSRIKIRGYRVELSEIELALQQQPGVEAAIVFAHQTAGDETQLVAHVVRSAGQSVMVDVLRRGLRATLPGYMVPAHFNVLEKLPLTPHGKIDRQQLRGMPLPKIEAVAEDAPKTEMEIQLAAIWQKVFNRNFIGRHDDFFDLGGDSLNATLVAAQVQALCGVELNLQIFAEHSTLKKLARAIESLPRTHQKKSPAMVRASRKSPLPLSFIQERTWKYSQSAEGHLSYTMSSIYRLRGALNAELLRDSMSQLVCRHEILRTTFDEVAGRMVQIIQPPKPANLPVQDFSGRADAESKAQNLLAEETQRGFDLQRGPLLRFTLVRLNENEHWLLRVSHHLICDAPSWKIYFRELALIYEAKQRGEVSSLPESETLQYGDYAAHQRNFLQSNGDAYREMVDWWNELFSKKMRPAQLTFRRLWKNQRAVPADGYVVWGLNPMASRRLHQLGRDENATFYLVRLAIFAAMLSARDERADLVFGTYMTDRTRSETQNMFGDFSNLVILILRCDHAQTFRQWLASVRKSVAETQWRSEIPYEQLNDELQKRGVTLPKPQVIFSITDYAWPDFGGLNIMRLEQPTQNMPWGISVRLDQTEEEHNCRLAFDARIYHPRRAKNWLAQFIRLLEIVAENPDWPIGKLLTAARAKNEK